jgi:hypothetical protein
MTYISGLAAATKAGAKTPEADIRLDWTFLDVPAHSEVRFPRK